MAYSPRKKERGGMERKEHDLINTTKNRKRKGIERKRKAKLISQM